ncbi:MAG: two-component regulator propeller domain-containing protein [Candidatus Solibacter sp.]
MTQWPWMAVCLLAVSLPVPAAEAQPASDLAAMLRTPGALQSRLRFDHLTTAEGLSNDSVFSILQDRHGFLWFGTQGGLNRYDGYTLTQYLQDPRNPNSIAGDFVQFLFEDSKGNIWCGRNALSRFDPSTETFTRYNLPEGAVQRGVIWAMREDRLGRLWMAMSGDLKVYRLDPKTGQYTAFKTLPDAPPGMLGTIESLHADTAGILWVGTSHGLVRFDPATGSSKNYPQDHPNPKIPVTRIRGIAQDGSSKLWLATNEGAVNFFDPVAGALSRRWAAPDPAALGIDRNNTIASGPDGILWLGTLNGLQAFDPATGAAGVVQHRPADRFSLSANEIWATTIDRDGDLWVGTKGGGVNRLSPSAMKFGAWRPCQPQQSERRQRALDL